MATKRRRTEDTEKTAADGKKFTIEKLKENCRQLFGVSTSTFAGASRGMAGTYTIEEMKAHIEAWKRKGVQ